MSAYARSLEARKIKIIIIMEIYGEIIKFLKENGKCLIIEEGKLIGVVLTMEEYEKIKSETPNQKPETNLPPQPKPIAINPIGAAMVEEMNFPSASANHDEINLADDVGDVTLENLGLDKLPY